MPDPKKLLEDVVNLAATPGVATDIGGIPNDLTAANTPLETPSPENSSQPKGSPNQANKPGSKG